MPGFALHPADATAALRDRGHEPAECAQLRPVPDDRVVCCQIRYHQSPEQYYVTRRLTDAPTGHFPPAAVYEDVGAHGIHTGMADEPFTSAGVHRARSWAGWRRWPRVVVGDDDTAPARRHDGAHVQN